MMNGDAMAEAVSRYRQMGAEALALANAADDRGMRVSHLGAAMHWLGLADDMEKFAAGREGAVRHHEVHDLARPGQDERRKNFELRQVIDEYLRMAAKAEESAVQAISPALREEYRGVAQSWMALASQLAGRPLANPAVSRTADAAE
jgi:hypothetical protein